MPQSVLSHVTLGFRPLWNVQRGIAAIQLVVQPASDTAVDAGHLLRTLEEMWMPHSPPLLLSTSDQPLLRHLLAQHSDQPQPWIEVSNALLVDASTVRSVVAAHERGLPLIWRGRTDLLPEPGLAACFEKCLLTLSDLDQSMALQAAAHWLDPQDPSGPAQEPYSPVPPSQMIEGITNRTLLHHCLDQRQGFAVLGWPDQDVLHFWQHRAMQPGRQIIETLLRVIDADESMDVLEQELSKDPLLLYRFLAHANSPSLGLQSGIDSVRRALMMIGTGGMRGWLEQQLTQEDEEDLDLRPVKGAMVLRAKVMEGLLDAGEDDDLRREVYLCGLFSQMDRMLGVSPGTCLNTLPLSERIHQATLENDGPYEPSLSLAKALERADGAAVLALCTENELVLEEVNRSLLRTLAALYVHPSRIAGGERRRRGRGRRFGK